MTKLEQILSRFGKKSILVIGDVILDKYIRGSVTRISPEAPVPIVLENESFYTPGGAANVAHNLHRLGAKVTLIGRIGDDLEGRTLNAILRKEGVDTSGLFIDRKIPTISKTRVLAHHQQVVRIDREDCGSRASRPVTESINRFIKNRLKSYDAVIISDYGKGLVTTQLVDTARRTCLANDKIIVVDPKVEHFAYYRGVTAITPNLNEAENAIRNIKITSKLEEPLNIHSDRLKSDKEIDIAGRELLRFLNLEVLLITLGERGMRLFEKGKDPVVIETEAREVFDVSGAGDTVISTFTLSLAAGATKRQAAQIANFAGGIVVGKMGAATVSRDEIKQAIRGH